MTLSALQDPPGGSSLRVFEAMRQGWLAFTKAPWVFVGFTLLAGLLNTLCTLIQGEMEMEEATVITAVQLVRGLVGAVLSLLVSVWSTTGLIRGAWAALSGRSPRLGTFSRWDGQANWRLFRNGVVLVLLLTAILVVGALLQDAAAQVNRALAVLPFLAALGVGIYLAVNQKFMAQLALLEGTGPIESIARGRARLDPQWGSVLLLGLLEIGLILLGLLACVVGLLVAVPVILCISTAAYRQVFGSEDLTGLLAEPGA
jgi:uncharacterized membrane protein